MGSVSAGRTLPRFGLLCRDREGSNTICIYEIEVRRDQTGATRWTVRVFPSDEECRNGEAYEAILDEVDAGTVRLVSVLNRLAPPYRGRGITPALLPHVATRLGRRIVWSPASEGHCAGTAAGTARLRDAWRHLVAGGSARLHDDGSFSTDGHRAAEGAPDGMRPSRPTPANEAEFVLLMEDVDAALRAQGVPIAARPLAAESEVSRLLAVEQWPNLAKGEPLEGSYEGIDLTIRIARWFDERYGASTLVDFRPGRMVVLLRGDAWLLHFPLFFGEHELFISRTEPSDSRPPGPAVRPPPRYNILDAIEGIPPGFRVSLTDTELQYLWDAFHTGLPAYLLMRFVRHQPFVREALVAHDTCVHNLLGVHAHPGTARWAALEAAEKMMKSALSTLSEKVPRTHNLSILASRLYTAGLEPIEPRLISAVQCEAEVRYGEVDTTLAESVEAHHASLTISRQVAVAIRSVMPGGDASWTGL